MSVRTPSCNGSTQGVMPRRSLALVVTLILLIGHPAAAQISTDGSLGPEIDLNGQGPDYTIPDTLGTIAGSNLYHSFDQFNINTGESATFTNGSGGSIQNVISRVTGGQSSSLDGTLRSQVAGADFYFLNPAGVIFGPNVQLDLPAALHVATAQSLRFSDDSLFTMDSDASSLSVATPQAFGFLSPGTGGTAAAIEIDRAALSLPASSGMQLVGGALSIDDAFLSAGALYATAVGDAAIEVAVASTAEDAVGQIEISNSTLNGYAGLEISGGELTISDNSLLKVEPLSPGESSQLTLDGETLSLTDSTLSGYDGGTIEVDIEESVALVGGVMRTRGRGSFDNAGGITVDAGSLSLNASAQHVSSIRSESEGGVAGAIRLNIDGPLSLSNGSEIRSEAFGSGRVDGLFIDTDRLEIDGAGQLTGLFSYVSDGNSVGIDLIVDGDLLLRDGGQIAATSLGLGNPGSVSISSVNATLDGAGGENTGISVVARDASVSADPSGELSLEIEETLQVIQGGRIAATTLGSRASGGLFITAKRILLAGGGYHTGIFNLAEMGATGSVGDGVVTASELLEINDARIEGCAPSGDSLLTVGGGQLLLDNGLIIGDKVSLSSENGMQLANGSALRACDGSACSSDYFSYSGPTPLVDSSSSAPCLDAGLGQEGAEEIVAGTILPPSTPTAPTVVGSNDSVGVEEESSETIEEGEFSMSISIAERRRRQLPSVCEAAGPSRLKAAGRGGLPPSFDAPLSLFFGAERLPAAPNARSALLLRGNLHLASAVGSICPEAR